MRRCFAAFVLAAAPLAAEAPFLLPDSARPLRYSLDLRIDPAQPEFSGRVRIDIEVRIRTGEIWLNAAGLRITRASVNGRRSSVSLRDGHFLVLQPPAALAPGKHVLDIAYRARFQQRPAGAYRRQSNGEWYVYTTFTAIEARRALPCFDEPRFKTPWQIAITAPGGYLAASNAPVARRTRAGRSRTTHFEPTLPLPAELVAFAVGPFDVFDGRPAGAGKIPNRVLMPRGQAAAGQALADAAADMLPRLEEYTGIPHPSKKLDQVVLLESAFGAVENPGLITYSGRLLSAGASALRGTVAHELAHQWFGNLVTQRTWEEVWLSEGFATWLGMKMADRDQPAERRGVAAVLAARRMMARDSGTTARPVRKPMRSVADMADVYSSTVYQKGAAILAMLENWLGEEPFRQSLHRYLRQHAHATATTAGLAAAIREQTGADVLPVLETFLDRTGVPALRAAVRAPCRLALNSPGSVAVPVCFVSGEQRPCALAPGSIALPACPPEVWFGNAGGMGYYRLMPPMAGKLPIATLTPAERMALTIELLSAAGLP